MDESKGYRAVESAGKEDLKTSLVKPFIGVQLVQKRLGYAKYSSG